METIQLKPDPDTSGDRLRDHHFEVGRAVDTGFRIVRQILVYTECQQIGATHIDADVSKMQPLHQIGRQVIAELDIPHPDIVTLVQPTGAGLIRIAGISINDLGDISLVTGFLPGSQLMRELIERTYIPAIAVQVIVPVIKNIIPEIVIELEVKRKTLIAKGIRQTAIQIR